MMETHLKKSIPSSFKEEKNFESVNLLWAKDLKFSENKFFFISLLHLGIHIFLFTSFLFFVQKDHLFINLQSWFFVYGLLFLLFSLDALVLHFYHKIKNNDFILYGFLFLNAVLFTLMAQAFFLGTLVINSLVTIYLLQILCIGFVKSYKGALLFGLSVSFMFFLNLLFEPSFANEMPLSRVFTFHSLVFFVFSLLAGFLGDQFNRLKLDFNISRQGENSLEHLHHLVADNIPMGVLTVGPYGDIIDLNKKGHHILGLSSLNDITSLSLPQEIKNHIQSFQDRFKKEGVVMGSSYKTRIPLLQEFESSRSNQKTSSQKLLKILEVECSRFKGRTGLWNTLLMFQDITKQVKKNKQKLQENKEAMIGRMITSVVKEFKQPLSEIHANLDLIDLNHSSLTKNEEFIQNSLRELKRLRGVMENFLDYVRPLEKSKDLGISEVDVNSILDELFEEIDFPSGLINLDITLASKSVFYANPYLIKQAFNHVLKNAKESMILHLKGQKESGHLKIQTFDQLDQVVVRIWDTGLGFEEPQKDALFDAFYTTKENATGLGLCIAKKIVESQNGSLSLTSKGKGKGALCQMTWLTGPSGKPEIGTLKKINPKICA